MNKRFMGQYYFYSVILLFFWGLLLCNKAFCFPPPLLAGSEENYIEGELLVKFKRNVAEAEKEQVFNKLSAMEIHQYSDGRTFHINLPVVVNVKNAVRMFKSEPGVEYAEPNHIYYFQTTIPNEFENFGELWGLTKIDAPVAWDSTTGSYNVVVGIIDDGIYYDHEDLIANIWSWTNPQNGRVEKGFNVTCVDSECDPGDPLDTIYGHGTHVAGIIGAVGNNYGSPGCSAGCGVVGVNWRVKLMACKARVHIGDDFVITAADAANCIDKIIVQKQNPYNVNVVAVNASWGGIDYNKTLFDKVSEMKDNGILLIAAAGNAGTNFSNKREKDNDKVPWYPASFNLPNVIAVAATNDTDNLSSWYAHDGTLYDSCYGRRSVHVGAPGQDILSTIMPNSKYDTNHQGSCNPLDWYCKISGTSMASPHVAGLAALIKSYNSGLDWRAIKNLILSGGEQLSLSDVTITGKRINADGSLNCSTNPSSHYYKEPIFSVLAATPGFGVPSTLRVLDIHCDDATGLVTVEVKRNNTILRNITLQNTAGDGTFVGPWTPSNRPVELKFTSSANLTETLHAPWLKPTDNDSPKLDAGQLEKYNVEYYSGSGELVSLYIKWSDNADIKDNTNSIVMRYNVQEGTEYILSDEGDKWITCERPAHGGCTYNSQAICCGRPPVTTLTDAMGNSIGIKITWEVTPTSIFAPPGDGVKSIYLYAVDSNGLDSAMSGDTPGVFRTGTWYLDENRNRVWDGCELDVCSSVGSQHPNGDPVSGDWNGTGLNGPGIKSGTSWYLDYNANRQWEPGIDKLYTFGLVTDIPVVGDWDGSGSDKIGAFRNGVWYLDFNGNGVWDGPLVDRTYTFGTIGDLPVTGNWDENGDTKTEIGVFRQGASKGQWYLDYDGNGQWNASLDKYYQFGLNADIPVTGDWNNDGYTEIGTFRNGTWYLDLDRSGTWNGLVDGTYSFGTTGDKPVTGRW